MNLQTNPEKTSILQKKWHQKFIDNRKSLHMVQKFGISEFLANLLYLRNVTIDEVENFLNPKIKNILPNPFDLSGMQIAVETIILAIKNNKKITIFGDYDVDGATSSAVLKRYFATLNIDVDIYIPDRINEGYGPNSEALLNLRKKGTDLVIMVDCGTVAFEPLLQANKVGLEIIVVDHHLGVLEKPKAIAIINPNMLDEKFQPKNICAVAVVFLLLVALNKNLRELNFFTNLTEPNLLNFLDLVALGTVCDVMPLTGLNRAFVAIGLKLIQQRKNLGLATILDLAKIERAPTSYSLGFIIGPRINAGGRVGSSILGATILSSNNPTQVEIIAKQLEEFNQQRKNIENEVLQQSIANLENNIDGYSKSDHVIFAVGYDWHQGVIGIVASKLKELYTKPVAVITIDSKTSKAKASCRSINGIDFGGEILKARMASLIIEGGGHAMAGGFSVLKDNIKLLHEFFNNNIGEKVQKILQENLFEYDITLDATQINIDLLKDLEALAPFGVGNPRPKFLLKNLYKIKTNFIGKNQEHLNIIFASKSNLGLTYNLNSVIFNYKISPFSEIIMNIKSNVELHIIGSLEINNWMGIEKIQLQIEDIIL
jgi:single-stranded-DNA-specific exonuclease